MSADRLPLVLLMEFLASDYDLGVVWDPELEGAEVSFAVVDAPIRELMGLIARSLGTGVVERSGIWFFGELKPEDNTTYVERWPLLDAESIRDILSTVTSRDGGLFVNDSGLVVLSDRLEVVERVSSLLEQVTRQASGQFVLQFYVVDVGSMSDRDFGFRLTESLGGLGVELLEGGAGLTWSATGNIPLVHRMEAAGAVIIARPTLVIADGSESRIERQDVVPIPLRTVLENGSVTTSGYTDVRVGFSVQASARSEGSRTRITYEMVAGEITGYVEESPIRSEQTLKGEAILAETGLYLVGSLVRENQRQARGLVNFSRASRSSEWLVFCAIERV